MVHLAVTLEIVAHDERFTRVPGPDTADGVADDALFQILVAKRLSV